MKKLSLCSAVIILLALVLIPTTSEAQSNSWSYNRDGSNEASSTRRERIRGYRQQSSEMQQKTAALGSTAITSVSMPVLFGVALKDISPNFGDPRSGGRSHEGEDIMAAKGTPIVSPTPAVVLRTGTGETEGNYVYTANPGGETFVYMHLNNIGEGVTSGTVLPQGGLIGYVGDTGNAAGGPAHLHFEIHDSTNNPVDPYPRLTVELTLQEKISYLSTILSQSANGNALSDFLVTTFRATFNAAQASGITLPAQIINSLALIPASSSSTNTSVSVAALPVGDLDVGASGAAVTALQRYLIEAKSGNAAVALTTAGATGYFGTVTKAALLEFQTLMGIIPSNGYYGLSTRNYIAAHPLAITTPSAVKVQYDAGCQGGNAYSITTGRYCGGASVATPVSGASVIRDLSLGKTGEDVRTLQKVLNANGFIVASVGPGSVGNETTYFGPATVAAVIKFQIAKGIVPAAGYVGSITRGIISMLK